MKHLWIGMVAYGLAMVSAFAQGPEEREIRLSDCPAAVRKTLEEEAKGAEIDAVTRETEDGKTTYWASVVIDGRAYEIGVAEGGTLTELSLESDADEVQFADCPAAVRETFLDESNEAKIDVVTKGLKYGVATYEAVVNLGGKEYAIVVAEGGTLVEKSLLVAEDEVKLDDCPAAVQRAFREEARGGKIGEVTRSAGINGPVFEAEVVIDRKRYVISVNEGGLLVSKMLDDAGVD